MVLALVASPIGATAAGAQSQAVFLTVQTSTTPAQPTSGDEFDLDVTITSAEAGTNNAYINRLSLVNATSGEKKRYETDYSIGQVTPGYSLGHSLAVELDDEGVYDLFLEMTVTAAGRQYTVYEPVQIVVYDGHPIVDASATDAMAGTSTDLSVDLANGLDEPIRNVELTLDSSEVAIEQPRRVAPRLESGETRSFSFRARATSPGDKQVDATIWYSNASGERRHVTRTVEVSFGEPEHADDLRVAADIEPTLPGSQTTMNVTVSNGLDVALRQLELRISGADVAIPQPSRVDGQIGSGEKRTYAFRVTTESSGPKQFTAEISYITEDGTRRQIERTLETAFIEPQNPGEVSLTGIDVERDGETLRVSGTASNVGGSEVSAVTVAVDRNQDVTPGRSQSEFFVGSIPESDFVSFDVNARLLGNETSAEIPLLVTYTIDDVRQEQRVSIQYEADQSATEQPPGPGIPFLPLGGLIVVLVVAAGGILYWRRR